MSVASSLSLLLPRFAGVALGSDLGFMEAYGPHHRSPASNSSAVHVLVVASSLRLGDHFRDICAANLRLVLHTPSSSSEFRRGYVEAGRTQMRDSEQKPVDKRMLTNVLLAVNVLVYAAQIATQGKLLLWGAKVNSLIREGQLWRLATSALLHANIGHLMINCYSLNSIGPTVEQLSGSRRFLVVYFSSAIASSIMSYQFSQSSSVGASGAIFGLVGSHAVFVLRHRNLVAGAKEDLLHVAHVIASNMVIGFHCRGIDNWGHLGGLLGGAAASWFLGPAWQCVSRTADRRVVFVAC